MPPSSAKSFIFERRSVPAAQPADADGALVARMANGDTRALAVLYERHAPQLLALATRILRDAQDAEDLLHDVFLEVWRHASDYSSERGTVSAWLGLRTRSRALDRWRSVQRAKVSEVSGISSYTAGSSLEAPYGSDCAKLERAFAGMSSEERQVILLGYFEGLTSREMAERINAPIGTVKSRTRSGLGKLRAWFAGSRA